MEVTDSIELPGVPDAFQRLWTPHRMVYISGENRPSGPQTEECPFCRAPKQDDATALIVHRGETCYALLNLFPYNPGHLLVVPYRHIADYTELSRAERVEFGEVTAQGMEVLRRASGAQGINVGMNQGQIAGAGIAAHLHQHLVPRWVGDANFMPVIGQTKALPQLLGQSRELLAAAWAEHATKGPMSTPSEAEMAPNPSQEQTC